MADNSFTMRVNLDFTAATKQLQDFERRNSLGISASKAASSHLAASGGPISGLHLDELSRAFRNLSRTVQATASNFDRLSAPFGGTRARLQASTTAAYAAGSAGISRTQSFLMALPGLTRSFPPTSGRFWATTVPDPLLRKESANTQRLPLTRRRTLPGRQKCLSSMALEWRRQKSTSDSLATSPWALHSPCRGLG